MCNDTAGIPTAKVLPELPAMDWGSYTEVPKFRFPDEVETLGRELLPGDLCERIFETEVNPLVASGFIFQACERLRDNNPEVRNIEQFLLFQTYDFVTGPSFPARNLAPSDHPTWAEELLQDAEAAWEGLECLKVHRGDMMEYVASVSYWERCRASAAIHALQLHTPFLPLPLPLPLPQDTVQRIEDAASLLESVWPNIYQNGTMPESWEKRIRDQYSDLISYLGSNGLK